MQISKFSGLSLSRNTGPSYDMITKTHLDHPSFWHRTPYAWLTRWKLSTKMCLTKCPALLKSSLWSCHSRSGGRGEIYQDTVFSPGKRITSQLFWFFWGWNPTQIMMERKKSMVIFYQFLLFWFGKAYFLFFRGIFFSQLKVKNPHPKVYPLVN